MKIVELVGANGVGKSTLYKKIPRGNGKFIKKENSHFVIAKYWLKEKRNINTVLAFGLCLFPSRKTKKLGFKLLIKQIENIESELDRYENAFGRIMFLSSKNNTKNKKVLVSNIARAMSKIKEVVLFKNTKVDKSIVLDESILHFIYACLDTNDFTEEDVVSFTESCMVDISGVVYLYTDKDTHLKNIKERAARNHVMPGHKEIINDNLLLVDDLKNRRKIAMLMHKTAVGKGVRVLKGDSRSIKVKDVEGFLSSFE